METYTNIKVTRRKLLDQNTRVAHRNKPYDFNKEIMIDQLPKFSWRLIYSLGQVNKYDSNAERNKRLKQLCSIYEKQGSKHWYTLKGSMISLVTKGADPNLAGTISQGMPLCIAKRECDKELQNKLETFGADEALRCKYNNQKE